MWARCCSNLIKMGLTVAGLLFAALSGAPLIIPSVANEINFDHTIKRHRYDRAPEGILKTFLKQGQCLQLRARVRAAH